MSDFLFEFGDGTTASFPQFTIKEYEGLQARVAGTLRKQNRSLAQEQGLTQRETADFCKQHDPRAIGPYEVEVFLADDREARKVLLQSQLKAGKTQDEAEAAMAKMSVLERSAVAKHAGGLVNLSPIPEESRLASIRMKAIARTKGFDGTDEMTVGEFYELMNQLVPPADEETPEGWFAKNTVAGTAKTIISAA